MRLPEYKGSMFRGAFGWSFRNAVCVTKQPSCGNCLLQQQCGYFKIFETELPQNDIWFLKGVRKIPHPFVLHPPLSKKQYYTKGELLKIGLTLFGSAINYLPFFVYTFKKMGELGISYNKNKFKLLNVTNNFGRDSEKVIYDNLTGILKNDSSPVSYSSIDKKDKIKINFITPFRIQALGKVIASPFKVSPELLIRALQNRYYSLAKLFGEPDEIEYPLIDNSLDIEVEENKLLFYNWERYSSRQKTKMPFGGFIGSLTLKGNLESLMPLLAAGEKTNIGKNTVFGLGEYKIV